MKRVEKIKNIEVVTSADHPFGTDALLLANFTNGRKNSKVCELGVGCGIISLLLSNRFDSVLGVDISERAIEQFLEGIEKSSLLGEVQALCADLKELPPEMGNSFDIVVCNPPYKEVGRGLISENPERGRAYHEIACNFSDVAKAAKKLLKQNSELFICHRPERLCDVLISLRENSLEPQLIRFVSDEVGKAPFLFLLKAKRNGGKNLVVHDTLYIKSAECERIYLEMYDE